MARDMSDAEIMKMELEQLQKEVKNNREPVSISKADIYHYTILLNILTILIQICPWQLAQIM